VFGCPAKLFEAVPLQTPAALGTISEHLNDDATAFNNSPLTLLFLGFKTQFILQLRRVAGINGKARSFRGFHFLSPL
jgi:hypothetical protein